MFPYDNALDHDDVVQEALIALWECCNTFDESRGYKFSTYAASYIRFRLLKFLRDTEPIRTPRYFKEIRHKISEYGFSFPLSEDEIAILLTDPEITPKKLHNYLEFNISSLDNEVYSHDSRNSGGIVSFSDMIADTQEDQTSDEELDEMINLIASNMKKEYRELVTEWMSSVVYDEKPTTQVELSKKYQMSQAHVSRILRICIKLVKYNKQGILDIVGVGGGDID